MTAVEPEGPQSAKHTHRMPTVAELRAMPDAELVRQHDARVAGEATGPISDIYLGELGRRMAELRAERGQRIALAALLMSATALLLTVAIFILVL